MIKPRDISAERFCKQLLAGMMTDWRVAIFLTIHHRFNQKTRHDSHGSLHRYQARLSYRSSQHERFEMLVANQSLCINQTCLDIFVFKPRICFKQRFNSIAGCQHAQNVFHRQSSSTNSWFATENSGVSLLECGESMRRIFRNCGGWQISWRLTGEAKAALCVKYFNGT